ncbi:MAG TPA: hypothetical protein VMU43_06760 [Candidatus Acidoferrum sp.]|nr:hypothetical protein [Candidatus Acidoferrum sp.]
MIGKSMFALLAVTLTLLVPTLTIPQDAGEKRTLIINGQSTGVPVIQMNGHFFIGLEELAEAVNGSLSYSGSAIALSVPIRSGSSNSSASTAAPPAPTPSQPVSQNPGFSQRFLAAGIEQMSTLREWHTALASAIENGFPLSAGLLAPYRTSATTNLRLAMVAVSTPSDRSAYQLLNTEFQNMANLSDKYVKMRDNLAFIAPDALQNDDLNQRIIACGHSLAAMAASGQFYDDGSCR